MLRSVPASPRWLGLAGLLPQLACVAAVASGVGEWRWTALAAGWAYAALILSFLGGTWWGLASAALIRGDGAPDRPVPGWLWLVAVAPSLLALATFMPWVFGHPWPGPSLSALGMALLATPAVDRALVIRGPQALAPPWWLRLRVVLSVGLGLATLVLAGAA